MERKKIVLIMVSVSIFCIGLLFFLTRPPGKKDGNENPKGKFTYTESEETPEDLTEQYDPSTEPGSELDANNVYITNYELLYDFLPVSAAGSVSIYAAGFLNEHGYGGYHELTILKNTISPDVSYPRFLCSVDDTDKFLEIRYRTDTEEFSFNLTDDIY